MEQPNSKLSLNEYAAMIHKTAVEKGWWEKPRNFGEVLMLQVCELAEAMEAFRDSKDSSDMFVLWYLDNLDPDIKPEGVAVELVDCIIRILDYLGQYDDLDIDEIMKLKMAYNERRPYRHGGKLA